MNVYSPEEVDRINKIKETNDRLEEFFNGKRTEWSKNIDPLFEVLKFEINSQSSKKIMARKVLIFSNNTSLTLKDCL